METKVCRTCNEEKSVSEFGITNKKFKTLAPYCKPCKSKKVRQWQIDNPTKYKQQVEKYISNNPKSYAKSKEKARIKYKSKIPAGVYSLYDKNELIYIGESATPRSRINAHFTKLTNLENAKHMSSISYAVSIGELKRENLTYKIIKHVDDTLDRKSLEEELINKYKPKYNTLGC